MVLSSCLLTNYLHFLAKVNVLKIKYNISPFVLHKLKIRNRRTSSLVRLYVGVGPSSPADPLKRLLSCLKIKIEKKTFFFSQNTLLQKKN